MISNVVILASCSFGAALFGFAAGLVVASSRRVGAATFPPTHVSFDSSMSDDDRLRFLDEAAQAVRGGRLRQPEQPQDDCPTNQAAKPGSDLEK